MNGHTDGKPPAEDAADKAHKRAPRRLLNFRQLKAMGIPWSREHVWRLEAANKFPRRIYLSPQRVAWFEDEVLEWLEHRAAERADRVYREHD